MSERYLDALWRARQALDAIEAWLQLLPDRSQITIKSIQQEFRATPISYAQASLALFALIELGIIEQPPNQVLNQQRLLETADLRQGLRQGLEYARNHTPAPPAQLLAALPTGLPPGIQRAMAAEARDLRASIIGLLTEAQEHLLLASPFWDEETMNDLGTILERRLQGGIHVDLLVRAIPFLNEHLQALAQMFGRLAQHPDCRIWTWNAQLPADHFGTQTFHFKCIVVDHGQRAYLGSANFTLASFRSRMELGILLDGNDAHTLSRLVTHTLEIAQLWKG
jgi:phosphatidylserine/phosphatidylglycerophosphate/cardiolipin synthase-like enzyme